MPAANISLMKKDKRWTHDVTVTATPLKRFLSRLSVDTRTKQFKYFKKLFHPTAKTLVLDVGATSLTLLGDSNLFEKLYPYPRKLTAVTIEDSKELCLLFPRIKVIKVVPGKPLPFKKDTFDIVVSWATLEHVGDYQNQEFFLNELLRVGKNIFVTTPDRFCPYEPHTSFLFLHWLPLEFFRKLCLIFKMPFWASIDNLNPLSSYDFSRFKLIKPVRVQQSLMFDLIPGHLIITHKAK